MGGKERGALSPPSIWGDEAKESMIGKDGEEKKKEREKDSSGKKEKDKKMIEENYLPATVLVSYFSRYNCDFSFRYNRYFAVSL